MGLHVDHSLSVQVHHLNPEAIELQGLRIRCVVVCGKQRRRRYARRTVSHAVKVTRRSAKRHLFLPRVVTPKERSQPQAVKFISDAQARQKHYALLFGCCCIRNRHFGKQGLPYAT